MAFLPSHIVAHPFYYPVSVQGSRTSIELVSSRIQSALHKSHRS